MNHLAEIFRFQTYFTFFFNFSAGSWNLSSVLQDKMKNGVFSYLQVRMKSSLRVREVKFSHFNWVFQAYRRAGTTCWKPTPFSINFFSIAQRRIVSHLIYRFKFKIFMYTIQWSATRPYALWIKLSIPRGRQQCWTQVPHESTLESQAQFPSQQYFSFRKHSLHPDRLNERGTQLFSNGGIITVVICRIFD